MAARRDAFKFIRWALEQRLKGARQAVLLVLAIHSDAEGKARPGRELLAKEAGLSLRAAIYALRSLEQDGYVRRNGCLGRVTVWEMTGALQPALMPLPQVQPLHPPRARRGATTAPPAATRGAPQVYEGCKVTMGELPRTTKRTIRSRSPLGDLDLPPSGGDTGPLIEAFLTAGERRKQVGALIDLGRALGVKLKGDRVAGIIRRYGRGQHLVNALLEAVGHRALEPNDYMEGVLRGTNRRDAQAGGSPRGGPRSAAGRAGAGGPDIDAWERYAAGDS